MVSAFYTLMLGISLLLAVLYMSVWNKHLDVHITLIFALVPVTNLGYVFFCQAQDLNSALIANRLTYVGGCYLPMFIMLAVFSLCGIPLSRPLRLGSVLLSTGVFVGSLSMGASTLFYRDVSFREVDGVATLVKEYGPLHTVFHAMLFVFFVSALAAMAYSYYKRRQVSRKTIYLMFFPEVVSVLAFFGGRQITHKVELIPAAYNLALVTYLIIAYRVSLYDITDTGIDTLVEVGETGFVSFDFRFRYLGSNQTAREIFPELERLTVDRPIDPDPWARNNALVWLQEFKQDEGKNTHLVELGEKTYLVTVSYLFDGRRRRGYQFFITDDTPDRQYINLLGSYNSELEREVALKTSHILEMHDKLILSMATMVESRDNSTGGHIRRTSQGVRVLLEEMKKGGSALSGDFCQDIIKAAPMHDLGKIAVDDVILRKPGRFTPEEFQKMKAHAAEGARIVSSILEGTDDEDFRRVAVNVAHFHHERWDGSGYPKGLKGEEIPLEARIMAVADVYDALVSKRVYKDSMSFEQADSIVMEGMGKQFDPQLEPWYVAARPQLEAYYSSLES